MGEASGRLLGLSAGSRPSRTRGQCAGSSRTMGPGTLCYAALTVSSMPSGLSTLDSKKTTNTKTSDCVRTTLPSAHGLARYPDPCLTKLFNYCECILTQEKREASPLCVGSPFIRFLFLLGKDTLALVLEFSEAEVGVAGKNVSTSQGRAPIRCRNRIGSGRTVDASISGALLRAAGTLSKKLPGHCLPGTTGLSSALHRCSSLHYSMALQFVTAALYSGFYSAPALSALCPRSHVCYPSFSALLHWHSPPHSANDYLCPLPGLSSALRRCSIPQIIGALLLLAPALSFPFPWRSRTNCAGALVRPLLALSALRQSSFALHRHHPSPTLAVSFAPSQSSSLCWAGALLGSSRARFSSQPGQCPLRCASVTQS